MKSLYFSPGISLPSFRLLGQAIAIPDTLDALTAKPENPKGAQARFIIIAGSGPTDRDRNYDKDGAGSRKSKRLTAIRFDDLISYAVKGVQYFRVKYGFERIFLLGHSQGSAVIRRQVQAQSPSLGRAVNASFAILKKEGNVMHPPALLQKLFKARQRALLLSWMADKPTEEIKRINPVLKSARNARENREAYLNPSYELSTTAVRTVRNSIKAN